MFCWASAQTRPKTVEFCLSCSHFYVCKDDRIFRKSQPALTDGLNSNTKCIVIVLIQHSNIVALNGYYYLLLAQASRASKFDRSLTLLYFYNSKPCHSLEYLVPQNYSNTIQIFCILYFHQLWIFPLYWDPQTGTW